MGGTLCDLINRIDPQLMFWIRLPMMAIVVSLWTLAMLTPFLALAILNRLVPWRPWRVMSERALADIGTFWARGSRQLFRLTHRLQWDIDPLPEIARDQSVLLICNHQSWVDVPVLMHVFAGRVPFFRFLIKRSLLWLPFLGWVFKALHFPALSRGNGRRAPHEPTDLERIRMSCEHYKRVPVTLAIFPEGTRFTPDKQRRQNSPYQNLLKPRSGGTTIAMLAMREQLAGILDVTIDYQGHTPTFLDLLGGRMPPIRVHVDWLPCPTGSQVEAEFQTLVVPWLNDRWALKDTQLNH